METPMMIARFRLDPHNAHYRVWGEEEMVNGMVGAELAIKSGGFVNTSGALDESGRYFVVFGVCATAAKLFDISPDEFIQTVLSSQIQKEFGVTNLDIQRRGE